MSLIRVVAAAIGLIAANAFAQPAPGTFPVVSISGGLSGSLGIANAGDGTNRLFVIQQSGTARVFRGGALLATPYFTISGTTQCRETPAGPLVSYGFTSGGERGLLGIAFHPSFETNGHLFVSYTDGNGDSMVARITASSPGADVLSGADLATCLVMLRVDQDFTNHNGGNVLFDPQGFLTFGLGDGGSGNDPCNRGQTLDPATLTGAASGGNFDDCPADDNFLATGGRHQSRALQGKLVRIDVDNTTPAGANGLCASRADGSANYAIPSTNPFLGANPACDETFAYGLRNPWRYSWDRANADFIVGDVGQDHWEEVSLVAGNALAGRNFDWRICEAAHARANCNTACAATDQEVIVEYHNTGNGCGGMVGLANGCSVTGGFRYRGPDPALQGVYFYGDACSSRLWYSAETSPGNWVQPTTATQVTGLAGSVLGFGEDENGVLHFVAGGNLYRIGIPELLFANGFE